MKLHRNVSTRSNSSVVVLTTQIEGRKGAGPRARRLTLAMMPHVEQAEQIKAPFAVA
jgi:hypothetical protein